MTVLEEGTSPKNAFEFTGTSASASARIYSATTTYIGVPARYSLGLLLLYVAGKVHFSTPFLP